MVSLKDIARVVNGLSLVAREGVSRSRSAQLKTLIKASILSAADVAGLTKGKLRSLDTQTPQVESGDDAHKNPGSVVYFTDESPADISAPKSEAQAKPDADSSVLRQIVAPSTSNASMDADVQTPVDADLQTDAPSTSNAAIMDGVVTTWKQRKPRERRVPSTPFSRAIG